MREEEVRAERRKDTTVSEEEGPGPKGASFVDPGWKHCLQGLLLTTDQFIK